MLNYDIATMSHLVLVCRWEYEQERIREQRWGRSHFTPHFRGEQHGDPRR